MSSSKKTVRFSRFNIINTYSPTLQEDLHTIQTAKDLIDISRDNELLQNCNAAHDAIVNILDISNICQFDALIRDASNNECSLIYKPIV